MADKRFTENTDDTSPSDDDVVPGTDISTGDDKKYTFLTIANKAKNLIGLATASVNGLMVAVDKAKLDFYPPGTPGNDKVLVTNGSGVQVWVDKTTVGGSGDMLKSVYDTGDNGQADVADTADVITGTPGNDKLYGTDGGGNQVFIDRATIIAELNSTLVPPTGSVMPFVGISSVSAPSGYVWGAGKTIGNSSSNASELASLDTFFLFELLYLGTTNTELQMYDSGGSPQARTGTDSASALIDYDLNYAMSLPDMRGKVPAGADNMAGTTSTILANASGLTSTTLLDAGGDATHILIEDEGPVHTHPDNLSVGSIGHSLTLPDHTHGITTDHSNGDLSTTTEPPSIEILRGQSGAVSGGSLGTGSVSGLPISITGSISGGAISGEVQDNVLGGDAHNITQPTIITNYIIKL